VADRVVVMNKGHIEQVGSPDEVYSNPASPFVYQFLGNVNVFHSRVHGAWAEVARDDVPVGEEAVAFIRPHDIDIDTVATPEALEAQVSYVQTIGPLVRVEVIHQGELVEVELTRERQQVLGLAPGQRVWLKPRQVKVFANGEAAPAKAAEKQAFLF